MQTRKTNFEITVEEAEKRLKQGQAVKAAHLYRQAVKIDFVEGIDSWEEFYQAKIHLGTALKDCKDYPAGRELLQKVIKGLEHRDIEERLASQRNITKFKISARHNLAKLELAFSQGFKPANAYHAYRNAMNSAQRYFKEAFTMVLEALVRCADRGQQLAQWFCEEYFKIKSNHLAVLLQEGEEFSDRSCLQAIVDDVERSRRFFKLHKSEKGEVHLYRGFYNKAMALRLLGREEESYKLLLEDYHFELENNQHADAQKSRKELLRYCLNHNLMTEARKYVSDAEQQQALEYIHRRREEIHQHFTQSPEVIRSKNKEFYQKLLQDAQYESNQYKHDYRTLSEYLRQALPLFSHSPTIRVLFYYLLAESLIKLQDYSSAEKMITQALKLPSDQFDHRDYEITQLHIWVKIPNMRKGVPQRHAELWREINTRLRRERAQETQGLLETQLQKLTQVFQDYQKQENKAKDAVDYTFSLHEEARLLNILENAQKSHNSNKHNQRNGHHMTQERHPLGEVVDAPNRKRQVFNPEEDYVRKCMQLGLPEKVNIRNALSKGGFIANPFGDCYNMSTQELHLLLPILKAQVIDLRNHMVDTQAIDALGHHTLVKTFKLSGINNPSNVSVMRAVGKMGALNYLSFTNFTTLPHSPFDLLQKAQLRNGERQATQEPRSIVHVLLLLKYVGEQFQPSILRVLKLKYCNITDGHLGEIDWQAYSGLQEVSLSHNLLQGRQLHSIMALKRISSINLSDNPLCTLSLQSWKHRFLQHSFFLRSLKCRQTRLSLQISIQLSLILERTKAIDLTGSQYIGPLISYTWGNYLEKGNCLQGLEEWRMSKTDLSDIRVQQLLGLLSSCPSLKLVDMRFCTYPSDLRSSIQNIRNENRPNIMLTPDCLERPNFGLSLPERRRP